MLTIRFARVGKKNKAQFKLMLQEHTFAPGGRHVEILGSYDPHSKAAVLKEERIKYWLSQGVKMSDTVRNLLVGKGLADGPKIAVKIPKKKIEEVSDQEAKPGESGGASASDDKASEPAVPAQEEAKEEKSE